MSIDRRVSIGDELQHDLDIRQNPRLKPDVGIFEPPVYCLMVNQEWFAHIGGAISALAEWRAWQDDYDERADSVQEILKLLGEGYCMFQLRQNPDDLCLLEQSTDNGETWTTAFDFSLCVSPALTNQNLNDAIDAINDLLAIYDDTVASIAPDMVYDDTPTDNVRDLALCQAVGELVDLMCEMELQYRREISLASNITGVLLGLLGIAITIGTGGTGTPFYLGLAASLAGGFGTIFGGLSTVILNDETARQEVACCMTNALKGETISQTAFEDSLDACGFTGGSNEAQLAGAISQMLAQDEIYETFLDYMQRAYRYADLGIANCGCDLGWEHTFDFSINNGGWVAVDNGFGNCATYISSTKWSTLDAQNGSGVHSRICWIRKTFADTEITKIEIEFDYVKGTPNTASVLAQSIAMWNNSSLIASTSINFSATVDGNSQILTLESTQTIDEITTIVRSSYDTVAPITYGGSCAIKSITVYGLGDNPF